MIKLKIIPASYGDSFLLSIKEENQFINILIDGGFSKTYDDYLQDLIKELAEKNQKLNLVINTHIDSDHIRGLISFFIENNKKQIIKIEDIWFNGLEQIINRYPNKPEKEDEDEKIVDNILKKGYEDEFEENEQISSKEGVALSGLIEFGQYNHNQNNNGKAINSEIKEISLSENVKIKIINPNLEKLQALEKEWLEEMNKLNFHFSIPKNQNLVSSFEFIISRLKNFYKEQDIKISSIDELKLYLSDLKERDTSIVNDSSISFVIEAYDKKLLFLGDAIIKNIEECNIIKELKNIYGENYIFDLIKLPHHGSAYNITKDFINLFSGNEYIVSTNSEKHRHPDLSVLANIICQNPQEEKTIIFNYPIKQAELLDNKEWKDKYKYDLVIGDGNSIVERSYK